jgi:sarcosine oxidase subunit gamma
MSALVFESQHGRDRIGMKGPRAGEWLTDRGIGLPAAPNSWAGATVAGHSTVLLVARLGTSEFFLEDAAQGALLQGIRRGLEENPPGIYPVLREDAAFQLSGDGAHDVLAQVCNVHFAGLALDSRPLIMTLMLGVAVLVVPQGSDDHGSDDHGSDNQGSDNQGSDNQGPDIPGRDTGRRYRIWCDPTFGPFLGEAVGGVVIECGGTLKGLSA